MPVTKMECVGPTYSPLAGTGLNTIRRAKPEYQALRPGSEVTMVHRREEGGEIIAEEALAVSSLVFGTFRTITFHHWPNSHGRHRSMESLRLRLQSLYNGAVGDGDMFCAIYFR